MTATADSTNMRLTWLPLAPRSWRRLCCGALACVLMFSAVVAWRIITWPRPTTAVTWAAEVEGTSCELVSEVFLPQATAGQKQRWPAVVLLHGIDGPNRYRSRYHFLANELRNQGYAVFLVHYFSAVHYPDLWHFKPDQSLDHEAIEQFRLRDQRKWVGAVTCALRQIGQRDDVDPDRIAIDGYSLGGFISLSTAQAALRDPQTPDVRCVVCHWGAMFRDEQFTTGFPNTLLLHGACDQIVEPKHAQVTCDALRSIGADVHLHLIPGGKHTASSTESQRLRREFFARQLGNQ